MDPTLTTHLNALKAALLTLKPTGQTGFEGLIALALHDILGVPFRLASSGAQRGIDGKTAGEGDVVAFEGKLYSDSIPRTEVLSKIADLGRNNDAPDPVWVLGATTLVSTQLADDLRADAACKGMLVVILDWSETRLPELALALAMSGERVERFLLAQIEDAVAGQAIVALGAVRGAANFALEAARLRASLDGPAMATRMAERANEEWLTAAFSDRRRARLKLGQALAPLGEGATKLLPRKALVERLAAALTEPVAGKATFALGDEGCGKSWVVVQAWSGLASKPLFVVMTADAFSQTAAPFDVRSLLIAKLIEQTGDEASDLNRRRWARRMAGWPTRPATDRPRLVVLIDGINQRPAVDWGGIIESMSLLLDEIGGSLMVTSRTPFFRDRVRGRLTIDTATVRVPEWSNEERDEILRDGDIDPASLHPTVAVTMRNPRLLGIALQLLKKGTVSTLTEVSVSRLLFEHIRTSEQEALPPYSALDFARRLQAHARAILDRASSRQVDDLFVFETDLSAVVDGRFFREVTGDPNRYELREHGLTLALGLSVVDRMRAAKRNGRDLDESLAALLEPIAAIDDTADVMLAALDAIPWLEDFYDEDLAASFVVGFANLQNPDQTRFPAFCSLAKDRPSGFLHAARRLCLAGGHQPNFDWVQGAVMEAAGSERAGPTVVGQAASWLSVHSVTPDVSMSVGDGQNSSAEAERARENRRAEIGARIGSLSEAERQIFERLSIVGDSVSALSKLAMFTLAGRPLAPHARTVLDWCFGQALNSDYGSPYNQCLALVGLNLVDWADARTALLGAAAPLRGAEVTRVGKWALASEVERLRTRAFGIIARSGDARMLRAVVDSGWDAAGANSENGFEAWYGSMSLIQAAKLGHADGLSIVSRISPRLYGHAAGVLGGDVARTIAGRIDVSIERAAGLDGGLVAPDIELYAPSGDWNDPIRFSVGDREPADRNPIANMRRLSETDQEFQERQRGNYDAFLAFREGLTKVQAHIVLDHLALEDFAVIVACAPEYSDRWYKLLSALPESKLPAVHNLAVLLAHALSEARPDRSRALLTKIKSSRPIVRIAFGRAGVGLDAMAIWAAHDGSEMDGIRFGRLDQARTDQELATEALAAMLNGKQDILRRYVERRVASEEPAHVARGIMVAGFSDADAFNSDVLSRFDGLHGLVGDACRAARYAYERNQWSRHWFAQLAAADDPADFWRAQVLLGKIVDGRFAVWRKQYPTTGSTIGRLGQSVGDRLKSRYDRWEKHRKKTLFGREAPSPFFLPPPSV